MNGWEWKRHFVCLFRMKLQMWLLWNGRNKKWVCVWCHNALSNFNRKEKTLNNCELLVSFLSLSMKESRKKTLDDYSVGRSSTWTEFEICFWSETKKRYLQKKRDFEVDFLTFFFLFWLKENVWIGSMADCCSRCFRFYDVYVYLVSFTSRFLFLSYEFSVRNRFSNNSNLWIRGWMDFCVKFVSGYTKDLDRFYLHKNKSYQSNKDE